MISGMQLDWLSFVIGGLCAYGSIVVLFISIATYQHSRRIKRERREMQRAVSDWGE